MVQSLGVRELRREYPLMNILRFVKIYEQHRQSPDQMAALMIEEELKALEADEAGARRDYRILEGFELGMQKHLEVLGGLDVPADVDADHARAILVFGFLLLGQRGAFAGNNPVSGVHLVKNVRNKMGSTFSSEKYEKALACLVRDSVVIVRGKKGSPSFALNVHNSPTLVPPRGRHNIDIAMAVLRAKQ
jgi:hypothetical protein